MSCQAASTLGYGAPGTDLDWGGSEQLGAKYSYAFEVWDGDKMPWAAAAAAASSGRSGGSGKGGAGAGAEHFFERELERDDGQPIFMPVLPPALRADLQAMLASVCSRLLRDAAHALAQRRADARQSRSAARVQQRPPRRC
mgnify:CR=1 FL=1